MNREYPHEIRRFADGEAVPETHIPLTEQEVAELDPMSPEERRAWIEENRPDPFAALKKGLERNPPMDREWFFRQRPMPTKPYVPPHKKARGNR